MRKKIGECLIQAGLITEEDLQIALAEHQRTGDRVGAVLVRLGFATEKQMTKGLAYQLGFHYASLADDAPDPAAIVLIPKEVALKRVCVAVRLEKNLLTVAMSDPLLFSLVQDLECQTGYRITQVVATRTDILNAIETGYPDKALVRAPGASNPLEAGDSPPIIDLVDLVVNSAITSRARDIHIEPMEKGVLVRHRLDGLLKEVMDLPKSVHEGLVARLKIMAEMDIAEKRLPQDGRIRVKTEDGRDVDFRVSTLRTLYGEKIVLRVLDHRKGAPPLEELGLSASTMEEVRHLLKEMRTLCSGCGCAVAVDFLGCPHCGHKLNAGCGRCGRALQSGWNFCPFCHAHAGPAKPLKTKSRDQDQPIEVAASNVSPFKSH